MQAYSRVKDIPSIHPWYYCFTFVMTAVLVVLVALGYVWMVNSFERHHVSEMAEARVAHAAGDLDDLFDDYQNSARFLRGRVEQVIRIRGTTDDQSRLRRTISLLRETVCPDLADAVCVYEGRNLLLDEAGASEAESVTNQDWVVAARLGGRGAAFASGTMRGGQRVVWSISTDTNHQVVAALAFPLDRLRRCVSDHVTRHDSQASLSLLDEQGRLVISETGPGFSASGEEGSENRHACFVRALKGGWKIRACYDKAGFHKEMRLGLWLLAGVLLSMLVVASVFIVLVFVRFSQGRKMLLAELERADAAERSQGVFFAAVSHDIRTPLNSILGFAELLRQDLDVRTRHEYLDNIAFSGNLLLNLLNDVLDLARLNSGKMVAKRKFVDPVRMLHLALNAFEMMAREKGVELKVEVGELPLLFLDERRCSQVIFNLVGNALKYTDRGSVTARMDFTPADDGGGVGRFRLEVQDTGIGIAAEDCAHLMDPYVRIEADNPRGGTGLGLAICRHLVADADGSIAVKSELGKGSTFTVMVPNVRCRERTGADAPAIENAVSEKVDSNFEESRILVVDDLEMNRQVLVAHCRALGVRKVDAVASGPEALAALAAGAGYDVVLTDKKMPGMDGYALIAAIRSQETLRHLALVLVTADVTAREDALAHGASAVLIKPFTRRDLARVLVSC